MCWERTISSRLKQVNTKFKRNNQTETGGGKGGGGKKTQILDNY